jgi:adenylyltransferase/sulfurtransferase
VTQYLAGAGVGCLGLVDADRLESSNLHRQPIYSAADVGKPKVALAQAAALRINPGIRIEPHAMRLTAENALQLVAAYDLVMDCSDNFRTKFLINDAAVLAGRAAVFASVYQFEGQLQVYRPTPDHACLRCPVPGIFGSLQALIALKLLLGIAGTLAGELMLMDFMSFTSTRLKAPRRRECAAPNCAHIRALQTDPTDLEVNLNSLEEAADHCIIDVRTHDEVARMPTRGRHIEMSMLLADPTVLAPDGRYLLLCATGKRSLAAARALRSQGFKVQSIAGGLDSIKP